MAPDHETIFTMKAVPVKFGRGASAEACATRPNHFSRSR
jgi:hypothetical protein